MKTLKYITAVLVIGAFAVAMAQVQTTGIIKKKKAGENQVKTGAGQITDRMQSFFETKEPSEADLEWMRVIYRSLDLKKEANAPLYYPEEPNQDGENLFFIIMRLLAGDQISAYEYLDGKELFTDAYRVKVKDMLDRFHILYADAKGSSDKHPKFKIEDSDVPSNEVLSYYIIEKYEFDRRSNSTKHRVEAICPVLHRTDEFGGEPIKYPMFWVKMSDLRPFLTQQYVFTDNDNNLPKYSLDDYFLSNMYKGEIYKTKNLRNLSLMQLYPDPDDLKHAQDSIENRLLSHDKNLWVPSREELQARAEALAAKEDSTTVIRSRDSKTTKSSVRSSRSRNKRGARAQSAGKVKQIKVKSSSNSSGAAHSVRRRK